MSPSNPTRIASLFVQPRFPQVSGPLLAGTPMHERQSLKSWRGTCAKEPGRLLLSPVEKQREVS
jgi:hypothetical protein